MHWWKQNNVSVTPNLECVRVADPCEGKKSTKNSGCLSLAETLKPNCSLFSVLLVYIYPICIFHYNYE